MTLSEKRRAAALARKTKSGGRGGNPNGRPRKPDRCPCGDNTMARATERGFACCRAAQGTVTIRECSSTVITGEHGGPNGVGVSYRGTLAPHGSHAYAATLEEAIGKLIAQCICDHSAKQGGVEFYRSQLVKQLEELADSYEPANSMDTTDMWKRDGVRDAIALVRGIEPRPAPAEASEDTKEQPWEWEAAENE